MNFKKSDAWVKYFQLNRTLHLCLKKKQKFFKKITQNPTKNINIKIIVHISTTFGPSNK